MGHNVFAVPGAILALTIAGIALAIMGDGYTPFLLALVALATVVGAGLNILVGLTGQISIGHVGFYAIGAYVVGVMTTSDISFWLALPAAALVAGAIGALLAIPALRVTGPYLAMMTIAFAFIVEHVAHRMADRNRRPERPDEHHPAGFWFRPRGRARPRGARGRDGRHSPPVLPSPRARVPSARP